MVAFVCKPNGLKFLSFTNLLSLGYIIEIYNK